MNSDRGWALLLLTPLAIYGLYRIVRDLKRAWVERHDATRIAKVERARVVSWLLSGVFGLVMIADGLLGGPKWLALLCFGGIGVAWVSFLILSFIWGAIGGGGSQ